MARKVWTFALEDGNHVVELAHDFWSGKSDITVDGVPVESPPETPGRQAARYFQVAGVPCVLILGGSIGWQYDLYVNGQLIIP